MEVSQKIARVSGPYLCTYPISQPNTQNLNNPPTKETRALHSVLPYSLPIRSLPMHSVHFSTLTQSIALGPDRNPSPWVSAPIFSYLPISSKAERFTY